MTGTNDWHQTGLDVFGLTANTGRPVRKEQQKPSIGAVRTTEPMSGFSPSLLAAVVADAWSADTVARHGAPGATAALVWDEGRPALVISDDYGCTWERLDLPDSADSGGVAAWLDSKVLALIVRHSFPYNRYPLTVANDEMAYLTPVLS